MSLVSIKSEESRVPVFLALIFSAIAHASFFYFLFWMSSMDTVDSQKYAGGTVGEPIIFMSAVSENHDGNKTKETLQQENIEKIVDPKTFSQKNKKNQKTKKSQGDQVIQGTQGSGSGLGKGTGSGIDAVGSGEAPSVLAEIRKKIFSKKKYPQVAQENNWTGEVSIQFSVLTNGGVSEIKIIKSSGYAILDEATVSAIQGAAPLPYYPKPIRFIMEYARGK